MTSSEIRPLPARDVPLLIPEARRFFAEAPIAGRFNELHFTRELARSIEAGTGICFVAGTPPRGAIAGVTFLDLATADLCCMEYFWYVAQSERGSLGLRLLDAFEKHLTERGVRRLMMMHLVSPAMDAKFSDLYERRGYTLREHVHVKELNP